MNILKTLGSAVVLSLILSGCTLFTQTPQTTPQEGNQMMDESKDATSGAMVEETKTFTMAEVAEHDSQDDCWLLIEGKVYDANPFIESQKHPGGAAIIQGCGIDATELFTNRPNGSGTHSEQARSFLPNFYIGDLAE